MDMYKYKPLSGADKIRILRLELATGHELRGQVTEGDPSSGMFTALSYVWGSSDRPFKITILREDGSFSGFIPLSHNLHCALHDLRAAGEIQDQYFWIDQICINQDDMNERSSQVALMEHIYKNAACVITYLGPAEPSDEEALRLLQRLTPQLHAWCDMETEYEEAWELARPWRKYLLLGDLSNNTFNEDAWRNLCAIATGVWSRRLWMIQENVLNKETLALRGTVLLSWTAIASVPHFAMKGLLQSIPIDAFEDYFRPNAALLFELRRRVWQWYAVDLGSSRRRKTVSLHVLLQLCHYHDCSDPRDRVFGLSALADGGRARVKPDYGKTVQEVLLDAASAFILEGGNLSILSYVVAEEQAKFNLPSWVPTWSGDLSHRIEAGNNFWCENQHWAPSRFDEWPTESRLRPTISCHTLTVHGHSVDYVARLFGALPSYLEFHRIKNRHEAFQHTISLLTCIEAVLSCLGSSNETISLLSATLAASCSESAIEFRAFLDDVLKNFQQEIANSGHKLLRVRRIAKPLLLENLNGWISVEGVTKFRNGTTPRRLKNTFTGPQASELSSIMEMSILDRPREYKRFSRLRASASKIVRNTIRISRSPSTDSVSVEEQHKSTSIEDTLAEASGRARVHYVERLRHLGRSICLTKNKRLCLAPAKAEVGDIVTVLDGGPGVYILRSQGSKYKFVGDAYIKGFMSGEVYREGSTYKKEKFDIE